MRIAARIVQGILLVGGIGLGIFAGIRGAILANKPTVCFNHSGNGPREYPCPGIGDIPVDLNYMVVVAVLAVGLIVAACVFRPYPPGHGRQGQAQPQAQPQGQSPGWQPQGPPSGQVPAQQYPPQQPGQFGPR
ncbi:hypothetical protein ALI144C_46735 [Actinosynnema sp. ALI-1.44]|uniref:hypothetical protein n=1 Tax=Actinosynnema sp. ALI-1.44 TaxID=1933779 RepID=UPI00097C393F|nr:hypothetical protein [Actinosynnema sp. ALI-1.44]ONI73402.1 hypothetical protein ALI144C_46735 [Actinosynnema sp. ALI-1.44]